MRNILVIDQARTRQLFSVRPWPMCSWSSSCCSTGFFHLYRRGSSSSAARRVLGAFFGYGITWLYLVCWCPLSAMRLWAEEAQGRDDWNCCMTMTDHAMAGDPGQVFRPRGFSSASRWPSLSRWLVTANVLRQPGQRHDFAGYLGSLFLAGVLSSLLTCHDLRD